MEQELKLIAKTEIPFVLPSLNEYSDACRINRIKYYGRNPRKWNKGNEMKQYIQARIEPFIKQLGKIDKPIEPHFTWIEPNRRRDVDNVAFAKKFILDSMVKTGVIQNDNSRNVIGFRDKFLYDKENPKVIIEVYAYE